VSEAEGRAKVDVGGAAGVSRDATLRAYLREKVLEGKEVPLCYPADEFAPYVRPVPEQLVTRLLPADLYERYETQVVKRFLAESSSWHPCPRSDCANIVHCDITAKADAAAAASRQCGTAVADTANAAFDVQCLCGHRFCCACRRLSHQPLPCEMIAAWQLACDEGDEEMAHVVSERDRDDLSRCRAREQELAIPHEMELGLRTQLQLVQAGLRVAFAKPTIATTVGQAVELLVISRGLLRLFIIAQHMLRRSSRVVPLSPSIDVHSSEQLEQQLSCLSQALSLMLNVNADDHAARPMSLPPTQSQAGDGGAAAMAKLSGVSEPEALILLKHAQLLLRHHATLLTLVQASILAVRELEQRLELLVSPLRSAAAHEPEQNSTAVSNAFMGLSSVLVGWMRGNDASTAYAACTPR